MFSLTEDQVREICRFREVIETAALGLAMESDCSELAHQLTTVLGGVKKSRRDEALSRQLDTEFHSAIVMCCGNSYLQLAYQLISDKIHALRARLPKHDEHVDACQKTHAAIVALVRKGNIADARQSLRRHIMGTETSYLATNRLQAADAKLTRQSRSKTVRSRGPAPTVIVRRNSKQASLERATRLSIGSKTCLIQFAAGYQ